jgi:hypothetical protein
MPLQARPAPVQARPSQQGSPAPPHATQELLAQMRPPLPHVRLLQQGWPAPPQAAQVPATQATDAAVHCAGAMPQQGCPEAPHVPQELFMQVPPTVGQVEPAPVQMLFTQQPPPAQLLAAQQA